MEFSICFLVIFGFLRPPWTDSLVVTKYDTDTLRNYYDLLDAHYKGIQQDNSFGDRNTSEYCHHLRHAYKIQIAKTKSEFWVPPSPPSKKYAINYLEIQKEKDYPLTILRIENTTLQGFWCLDNEKELKWLVTPAFIPNSAFLFTTQSPSTENEIEVNFEGLIDELATESVVGDDTQQVLIDSSMLWKKKSYRINIESKLEGLQLPSNDTLSDDAEETDPLCSLNAMLQYRLCAIYSRATRSQGIQPLEGLYNYPDHPEVYENILNSRYTYPDEKCLPLTVTLRGSQNQSVAISRKTLRCFINNPVLGPGNPYYLIQHHSNPNEIFYINKVNERSFKFKYTDVPLLHHIKEYEAILKDFTLS